MYEMNILIKSKYSNESSVFMKKRKKLVLISMVIIVVLVIVLLLFIFLKCNKEELFIHSYENYAFAPTNYGYIIYSDGTIKEYDDYHHRKNLKKQKITEEELAELKVLANKVKKDQYKKDDNRTNLSDMGSSTTKIYNSQSKEWIILYDWIGSNNSEESQKIRKLTVELYQKYLNR